MNLAGLSLVKIDQNTAIKSFDCGDTDLNSFLLEKSIHYKNELLATTYLLENEERTIAFFSIFNDSVRVEDIEFASKTAVRRLLAELVSHPKRHLKYFPAIKIGRLAVCNKVQKKGIGKAIVNFIINLAVSQNDNCACKVISVDAYDQSLAFYTKMGFVFFTEADKGKDTRQMYLDLTPIINTAAEQ
jgi:GNAT superfamily N-acetyltransferase